jgi:hypothetical protein
VRQALDAGGALLMMAGAGSLLYAVSSFGHAGFGSPPGLAALAGAAVAFAVFAFVEARHPNPLLPLAIFREGDLLSAGLALAALLGSVGAIFVMCSLYMQNGLHLSAARSGLGMIPVALGTIAAGRCAPLLMKRFSLRTVALLGVGVETTGLALLALGSATGRYELSIAPFGFLAIFGSTTGFVSLMGLATNGLRPDQQGTGSALLFTGQQIGLPVGVAVSLAVFKAATDPTTLTSLEPYRMGFVIPAGLAGLSVLLTLIFVRARGPAASAAPIPAVAAKAADV